MWLYGRATAALVLPIAVDVVVPWALLRDDAEIGVRTAIAGVPAVVAGVALLADCVFLRFAREGRGTLAPIDPPRFVVRGGAYQFTRNPMYVANLTILGGIALAFGSVAVAGWAAVMALAFHLFVVLYEEPTLLRTFGEPYAEYRETVARWLPIRGRSPRWGTVQRR